MKRLLILLFLGLLVSFSALAQGALFVSDFTISNSDEDGQISGVSDKKGVLCALVKVKTTVTNLHFSSESEAFIQESKGGSQIWFYAPSGTKTIVVSDASGKRLSSYEIGYQLRSGKTYVMSIDFTKDKSKDVVVPIVKANPTLHFDISPANATLKVNGQIWQLDVNGSVSREVPEGVYSYRVEAKNHAVSEGKLTVDSSKQFFSVSESLSKKIGWVNIMLPEGMDNAEVYIDGNYMGALPLKAQLGAGKHAIRVEKYLYIPFEQEVEILEKSTQAIVPVLTLGFAKVRLTVPADAEIYVDGLLRGSRSWEGALPFGKHSVECRQDGCRPTSKEIEVSKSVTEIFDLDAPKQIFGSLSVTTNLPGVTVIVDGKPVGITPLVLNGTVLVGDRSVQLQMEDCIPQNATVAIEEGKMAELSFTMVRTVKVNITSSPSNAALVIDGDYVGLTPYSAVLEEGTHTFSLTGKNAYPLTKTQSVDRTSSIVHLAMKRQLQQPHAIYIEGDVQALGFLAVGGSIGGFIKNVNLEANYLMGLSESGHVYWNNAQDMTRPTSYVYKPAYYGGKVGYGIILGTRFRITPQVGVGVLQLKGSVKEMGAADPGTTDAYAVPVIGDVRFDLALAPYIGLSVCPGYSAAVVKSDVFKAVSEASKQISGYATGFSLKAGLYFYF